MSGGPGFVLFALSFAGAMLMLAWITLDDLKEEGEFDDVL